MGVTVKVYLSNCSPAGILTPSWCIYNMNSTLIVGQCNVPVVKSSGIWHNNIMGRPRTACSDTSSPKLKVITRGLPLRRMYDLNRINTIISPCSSLPTPASIATSNFKKSHFEPDPHSAYSSTISWHWVIIYWWYTLLPVFVAAPVSTSILVCIFYLSFYLNRSQYMVKHWLKRSV